MRSHCAPFSGGPGDVAAFSCSHSLLSFIAPRHTAHSRAARDRSRLASASPTNSSFAGSIVSLRPRIHAIAAAWQANGQIRGRSSLHCLELALTNLAREVFW
jgi:hypothetical protein